MSVIANRAPIPDEELTLEQIAAQKQTLREMMDRDQAEIERLATETRELRISTRATIDELLASARPCRSRPSTLASRP